MMTTKAECARSADKAFIKTFQEPVRVLLRDGSIVQRLLNAIAHFGRVRSLDRSLYIGDIHACISGDLLEGLTTLQRRAEFIGRHIEDLGGGGQFHVTEPRAVPISMSFSIHGTSPWHRGDRSS